MGTRNMRKLSKQEKLSWDILKGNTAKLEVYVSHWDDNTVIYLRLPDGETLIKKADSMKTQFQLNETFIGMPLEVGVAAANHQYSSATVILTRHCSYHFSLVEDRNYA
jgi:hypothetical protein